MLSQRVSPVFLCVLLLAGCASRHGDEAPSTPPTSQRNKGNATVRAAIYLEAAPNVAAASPRAVAERSAAPTAKNAAARNKQDKRSTTQVAQARRDKRTAPSNAAASSASALAATHGRPIAQHVSLSASGFRYTYAVELDSGVTQTYGFVNDPGFAIGDRVLVNDAGVVAISK